MRFLIILFVLFALLQVLALWGAHKCIAAGGNWIEKDYGKHCVDAQLNDIEYL